MAAPIIGTAAGIMTGGAAIGGTLVSTLVTGAGYGVATGVGIFGGNRVYEATSGKNLLRDNVFGGNEEAFNTTELLFNMAGTGMVVGASSLPQTSSKGNNNKAIDIDDDNTGSKTNNVKATEGAGKAIENPIIGKERVGSALKDDFVDAIRNDKNKIIKEFPATAKGHGFSDIIDNYAGDAVHIKLPDGADLYQLSGSNNGVLGRFEWIVENEKVTHRMFIENGTINGRPILP